jgi:uncharacterized membrane protein YfcA
MVFGALLAVVAAVAGAIASVAGFGIGSLLTPAFGLQIPTKLAVAAVSVPHLVGTALRFWFLRARVDRRVLLTFGAMSAAGGLTGALLHNRLGSPWLSVVFGSLLLFVAASEFSGLARRMRFRGPFAWCAGALSGLLGGLVGNQGGIRSAALMSANLERQTFVATATAIGLIVDGARMPVYLAMSWRELLDLWPTILVATVGVVVGTLFGQRVLRRMPERIFRPLLAALLATLGATMLVTGLRG